MDMVGNGRDLPVRLYVPPTAFLAAGVCASALLMLEVGWRLRDGGDVVSWPGAWALSLMSVLAFVFARRLRGSGSFGSIARPIAMLGMGVLIGCVAATGWLLRWQAGSRAVLGAGGGACVLLIRGDPSAGERGFSSTALMVDVDTGKRLGPVRVLSDAKLENRSSVRAVCRVKALDDSDYARSRFAKGEVASARIVSILEQGTEARGVSIGSLRVRALRVLDAGGSDYRALVAGTVCGRTTELNQSEAQADFSACGLTHLVAVSGSHFAYIAAMLERALRHAGLSKGAQQLVMLLVMAAYMVFTGGAPSAIRSVCMVAIASAAIMGHRRAHAPSGLAIAVAALVAVDPGVVYDLGFRLSVASVLFIILFGPYVRHHLCALHVPAPIADALSITLVAQWATLPLTLPVFGEVSLVSPLANLLVGPAMSGLLVTGLLGTGVATISDMLAQVTGVSGAAGAIAEFALAPADGLARLSVFFAQVCAGIPFALVSVESSWVVAPIAYGAALLVYVRWRPVMPKRLVLVLALVFACIVVHVSYWTRFAPPEVIVLDIGQGDAILIRDGPSTLLVDAGIGEATRTALARNHVFGLDGVVVTHWDKDHWGGLPDVLEGVRVDRLYVADGAADHIPAELSDGPAVSELREGDAVRVGSFVCELIWPDAGVRGDENADSAVLDVSYEGARGGLRVLLTGDTERDELESYMGEVGDIDVLKLGHHGSRVSVSAKALDSLLPELCVASAGEGNRYGHPNPTCVRMVEASGSMFLCTKDVGDIHVTPGHPYPRFRTQR